MADTVQFRLVDAFAETRFTGNPAGVVLDADRLNDKQMQVIAREINASETAFLCRANDLHRPAILRWFSPTTRSFVIAILIQARVALIAPIRR